MTLWRVQNDGEWFASRDEAHAWDSVARWTDMPNAAVYRSDDAGETWTLAPPPADPQDEPRRRDDAATTLYEGCCRTAVDSDGHTHDHAEWKRERDEVWAELAIAETERDAAMDIVRDIVDDDPCDYDHHDYCQTHGLHSRPCANERAVTLIAAVDQLTQAPGVDRG